MDSFKMLKILVRSITTQQPRLERPGLEPLCQRQRAVKYDGVESGRLGASPRDVACVQPHPVYTDHGVHTHPHIHIPQK